MDQRLSKVMLQVSLTSPSPRRSRALEERVDIALPLRRLQSWAPYPEEHLIIPHHTTMSISNLHLPLPQSVSNPALRLGFRLAWLFVIGYGGVSLPFIGRRVCTERLFQRSVKVIIKAAYYFPGWTPFLGRMMSVLDSRSRFDSHQLHVTFPRVIPASAELFALVQKGNIEGVQRLFLERAASGFDVNA